MLSLDSQKLLCCSIKHASLTKVKFLYYKRLPCYHFVHWLSGSEPRAMPCLVEAELLFQPEKEACVIKYAANQIKKKVITYLAPNFADILLFRTLLSTENENEKRN